jgi:hypothetical protein
MSYETNTGPAAGSAQWAAVRNLVLDNAEPEQTDTKPGMLGIGWITVPT